MKKFLLIIAMSFTLLSMSECEKQRGTITSLNIDGIRYYSNHSYLAQTMVTYRDYSFNIYEESGLPAFNFKGGVEIYSDKGPKLHFGLNLSFLGPLKLEKKYHLSETIEGKGLIRVASYTPEPSPEWIAKDGWIEFTQFDRLLSGSYEISANIEFSAVDNALCDTIYVTKGKIYAPIYEFY